MRGPHVSGDNLFFLFILIPDCPKTRQTLRTPLCATPASEPLQTEKNFSMGCHHGCKARECDVNMN